MTSFVGRIECDVILESADRLKQSELKELDYFVYSTVSIRALIHVHILYTHCTLDMMFIMEG